MPLNDATLEDIVDALRQDPHFQDPEERKRVEQYVPILLETIGNRIHRRVIPLDLLNIAAVLKEHMKDGERPYSHTEESLLSSDSPLDGRVRYQLSQKKLTYNTLLRTQPGVFFLV